MTTQIIPVNTSKVIPGPRGYPFIGPLPELLRDPLQFVNNMAQEYGDVVGWKIGPQQFYLLNHPDHFKHILLDNHRNYHKGVNFKTFERFVGKGIGLSEGDFWLRQRRLVQPAFHRERLARLTTMMTNSIGGMLQGWEALAAQGTEFDVADEMRNLTLQIIVKTMFNSSIPGDMESITKAFCEAVEHVTRSFWLPIPSRLIPGNRRYEKSVETLNQVVYRIIDERRRSQEDSDDMLSMLLNARDADTGEGMSDEQLRNEVMNMFFAGHETTANTLSWVFHFLSQYPDIEERLLNEIDTVLGGRLPTIQDLPKLVYTKMVLDETLRIATVTWFQARTPLVDDVIDGYVIRAGSVVLFSSYVLHHTPSLWPEPKRFDPERFTPEQSAARPRYAYVPFSAGPRQCIGNAFGLMEMQLVIAMLFQRYRLVASPTHQVKPHIAITLRPDKLPMSLQPRAAQI